MKVETVALSVVRPITRETKIHASAVAGAWFGSAVSSSVSRFFIGDFSKKFRISLLPFAFSGDIGPDTGDIRPSIFAWNARTFAAISAVSFAMRAAISTGDSEVS